ncbi:WecB/TagA/CpsF family glycosyltransferase [Alkalibacillus sp. S2W]|uniref:WecB/TagA/CpsF family glycosyltransferase n=1 Tax=Alkalibacillus sp. S2W TaxID=3386553 RepID=UPI00398CDBD3
MSTDQYVHILDIPFINTTKEQFIAQQVLPALNQNIPLHIVTANPEIVMNAHQNPRYHQIVKEADYVVPDGIGVIMASNLINNRLNERIPGIELFERMLEVAHDHNKSVYFLGAKEEVVEQAVTNIQYQYPELNIAGYHHGYIDIHDQNVFDEVKTKQPDFIFVALGFPKQDEWIHEYKGRVGKGILMGVGGSFDVMAGESKRAPKAWIKLNLEWLYRLIKQPSRFIRVLKLPLFLIKVLWGKYIKKG